MLMLETSEERVRLLKKGISGKTIERLYVTYNGFIVVGKTGLFGRDGYQRDNSKTTNREVAIILN